MGAARVDAASQLGLDALPLLLFRSAWYCHTTAKCSVSLHGFDASLPATETKHDVSTTAII